MTDGICDIDKTRPATHTVRVNRNGTETEIELCDTHYRQLMQSQSQTSPFESLFSGFGDSFGEDFPNFASQLGYPLPREREATNIEEYISEHTKEIIQQAAEAAVRTDRADCGAALGRAICLVSARRPGAEGRPVARRGRGTTRAAQASFQQGRRAGGCARSR